MREDLLEEMERMETRKNCDYIFEKLEGMNVQVAFNSVLLVLKKIIHHYCVERSDIYDWLSEDFADLSKLYKKENVELED